MRECSIYKPFNQLQLHYYHVTQLVEAKKPKCQLCQMHFLRDHECIFGKHCQFAHKICDVTELISEVENKRVPYNQRRLFKNLGVGPSLVILSYFSPEEMMINLRRVNKEALALCKRIYSARVVPLEKITLRSVKFFERAQEIRISKESLTFFSSYKDEFLTEILDHYRNVKAFTINLNFLFDDQKKDRILDKISSFAL